MSENPMRDYVKEAIDLLDDPSPERALTRLLQAAREDDLTLASTVRELMPLLAFGLFALQKTVEQKLARKPKGRPKVGALSNADCHRAYSCWQAVTLLGLRHYSNREAIELVRQLEAHVGVALRDRAFPSHLSRETLEQSVSRGKAALGFTGTWDCTLCEEIRATP